MSDDGKPDLPKREHISPDAARKETKRIAVNASERPNPRFEAAQRRTQRRLETASRSKATSDADGEGGPSGNGSGEAPSGGSGFSFNMTNKPAVADPPSGSSSATPDDTLDLDELTEMAGELGVSSDDAGGDLGDDSTDVTLDS